MVDIVADSCFGEPHSVVAASMAVPESAVPTRRLHMPEVHIMCGLRASQSALRLHSATQTRFDSLLSEHVPALASIAGRHAPAWPTAAAHASAFAHAALQTPQMQLRPPQPSSSVQAFSQCV
jgi:hypothetical protein